MYILKIMSYQDKLEARVAELEAENAILKRVVENPALKVVTPNQLGMGWFTYNAQNMTQEDHKFLVIRKMDDGNYIVVDPSLMRDNSGQDSDR